MHSAVENARKAALGAGTSPIACLIVRGGQVLAMACNEVEKRGDPTAHAEMLAIRMACEAVGDVELRGATLYSTLQPCGMCTMASIWAKVGCIVYGAGRNDVHHMYFEDRHLNCTDFVKDAFREDLMVIGGVLLKDCAALYPGRHMHIPRSEQANL